MGVVISRAAQIPLRGLGRRAAVARGLTQDEFAQSSGVSVDTISRLERGASSTARRSTLAALSRALGLCRAAEVLALPDLHDAASGAWSDCLAGRRTELLAGLPALMVDTRRAAQALADDHAAEAAGLLAASYRLAAGLSGRLGLVDLAAHAAHRALDTARFTTRPELDEAAALRYLAVLVRQGDLAEAERVAVRAAERLDGGLLARPDADRIGVFGSLLFNAASAAAVKHGYPPDKQPGAIKLALEQIESMAPRYAAERP